MKFKSLFRKLRKLALRHGGVVVFFDEADALGNRGIVTTGQRMVTDNCHGGNYLSESAINVLTREKFVVGGAANQGGGGGMLAKVTILWAICCIPSEASH